MSQSRAAHICRIGVFYDGSYFVAAQRYFQERSMGRLDFKPFHELLVRYLTRCEPGHAIYKVVCASWHQGVFKSSDAHEGQLRSDRILQHDLMHAGIAAKCQPMSEAGREKGIDVALAVDALQVGLEGKIDVAVLVTGDGDFVPLVRALNAQGVRVLGAYFEFTARDGKKGFVNERLRKVLDHPFDVCALEHDEAHRDAFRSLFYRRDDGDR